MVFLFVISSCAIYAKPFNFAPSIYAIVESVLKNYDPGVLSTQDLVTLYEDVHLSTHQTSDFLPLNIYPEPRVLHIAPHDIPTQKPSFSARTALRRQFMDQARRELNSNRWIHDRSPRFASAYQLLGKYNLKAANYIGIKKIHPSKTYCKFIKLSKLEVIKIKEAMVELKEAFNFNMDFRNEAKRFCELGHFTTKNRWFRDSYYSIEKLADHVIECARHAISIKSAAQADLRIKIKQKLKESIFSKALSILGGSALLAGTRVISFASAFVKGILDDPFEAGKSIISGIGQQIVEVFQLLGWEDKINNPQHYYSCLTRQNALQCIAKEICSTTHGLMGKIHAFTHLMETNPRQATVEFFATAMEFALLNVLIKTGAANYQSSKFIKPAVDSMKSGLLKIPNTITLAEGLQKIRTGLGHDIGLEVADTPILITCSELGEIGAFLTESLEKRGIERGTFRRVLEIVEKNPDIVVGKKTLSDIFKECVHLSPSEQKIYIAKIQLTSHLGLEETLECMKFIQKTPWTLDRFKHVMIGDMSANSEYKLYGGLHTWDGFQHFLKLSGMDISEFMIEDLGNGVLGVRLPKNAFVHKKFWRNAAANLANGEKLEGVKTFWPKHFTNADIINAGNELFADSANVVSIQADGAKRFSARLSSGLHVKGIANKEGAIQSAYPTWIQ